VKTVGEPRFFSFFLSIKTPTELIFLFCSFAYVDFVTKEAKEQAIALSEQNLDGRKLLIKDGEVKLSS